MKAILTLLALWVLAETVALGEVLLNTGESFVHTFTSIPFERHQPPGGPFPLTENAHFVIGLSNSPAGTVLVEAFEDNTNAPPFFSQVAGSSGGWWRVGRYWPDIQGALRVTAISGPVILTAIQYGAVTITPDGGQSVYNSPAWVLPLAHLKIARTPGETTLSWPAQYQDWKLESSEHPEQPDSWGEMATERTIVDGTVVVREAVSQPSMFYRLRNQIRLQPQ